MKIKVVKGKSIQLENVYDGVIKGYDGTYICFNAHEMMNVQEFYSNPANTLDERIENKRISERHRFYKRLVSIVNQLKN